MTALKLFVVGEASGDPWTWSSWHRYAIVIADSKEQARTFSGRIFGPVSEIDMTKPQIVTFEHESSWDEDS